MGRLSHQHKLTARTPPELEEAVKTLVPKLATAGFKFTGRALGIEGLICAVMLEFMERSPEEQRAILARRLPEIEDMLGVERSMQPEAPAVVVAHSRPAVPPERKKGAAS